MLKHCHVPLPIKGATAVFPDVTSAEKNYRDSNLKMVREWQYESWKLKTKEADPSLTTYPF